MNYKHSLLILDYGGVYSFEYNPKDQAQVIYDLFGKSIAEFPKEERSHLSHQFTCGEISTKKYIEGLSSLIDTNSPASVEQFETMWLKPTLPPSPVMVELVQSIKAVGIKVALLTDVFAFEAKLAKQWGRYDGFDKVFLSSKEHATKRDSRFFELVLKAFDVAPEEALFVDDGEHCVDTAQSLSMDTLLADKETYASAEDLASKILQLV